MKNSIKKARGLKILFIITAIISCCFIYNSVRAVQKEEVLYACNELTAVDMAQLPPSDGIGMIKGVWDRFLKRLTPEDIINYYAEIKAFNEEIAFSVGEVQAFSREPNNPALLMWRRKLLVNFINLFKKLDSSIDLTKLIELEQRTFQVLLDEQLDWERNRRVLEEQSLVVRLIGPAEQQYAEKRRTRLYDAPEGYWFRGIAGSRAGRPTSVTIHNTAGDKPSEYYRIWLLKGDSTIFAAHEYWDENGVFCAISHEEQSWHCGKKEGNLNSIGLEICRDFGEQSEDFLQGEQNAFIRAAEILTMYGLPANADTIKLHCEWSETECPWRTIQVHGHGDHWDDNVKKKAKAWVISEIARIMQGNPPTRIEEIMETLNGWPKYEEVIAKRQQMGS